MPKGLPLDLRRAPKAVLLLLMFFTIGGCSSYRPSNTDNICSIFWGETNWYEDARKSNKRWGTPIGVMMAIIKQESSFRADVRPKRPKWLFIPLPRKSSAYGYAQAQDAAWHDYRKATGNKGHDRDDFGDAINFVGWYTHTSQQRLGISKWDPYQQYLAYHEGWGGFGKGSYKRKPKLVSIAKRVKSQAEKYNAQLSGCTKSLDKAVKGWF